MPKVADLSKHREDFLLRLAYYGMFAFCLLAYSTTAVAETAVGVNAVYVQTAMDNDGNIHMVCVTNNWGSIFYVKYNRSAGSWTNPSWLLYSTPCVWPFNYPDISVGPDGKAQIVYGSTTGAWPEDLDGNYLARANDVDGSSFSYQMIGNFDARRAYLDVSVDDNNQAHVVYEKGARSSQPQDWFWEIVYRHPDGTEKTIRRFTNDQYLCHDPSVWYDAGFVNLAWYEGGASVGTNNIWYGTGQPDWSGDDFVKQQVTNTGYLQFAYPPEITVGPGFVDIAYLGSDWSYNPPQHTGLWHTQPNWPNGQQLDPDWAAIDEEHEDQWPNIAFDNAGTRYVSWSFYSDQETYYMKGDQKFTLEPYGNIDVCAGNGAFYVRVHSGPSGEAGPVYFEEITGGGPQYFPPTAIIDDVTPNPLERGVHFVLSLQGTAYDNDENGASITAWEWTSLLEGMVIGTTEDAWVNPIDLSPGLHVITFKVKDDEDVWSEVETAALQVLADTIPPPSVTDLSVVLGQQDTLLIEWEGVTDNFYMERYDLFRDSVAWFVPGVPIVQILEGEDLAYDDGDAFAGADETAFYGVIPVDVDDNTAAIETRAGAFRFPLSIGNPEQP